MRKSRAAKTLLRVVALAMVAVWPATAAAVLKVGSFIKASGTQSVLHGLGETPKALILWTGTNTVDGTAQLGRFALGAVTVGAARSVAFSSQNNVQPTNVNRRMAAKALTMIQGNGTLIAEADLASWDAMRFTLTWATTAASATIIHFIAIGGPQVRAEVVSWQTPTGPADQAVPVSFPPTAIINFHGGADLVVAPPHTQAHGLIGMGVQAAAGQWATGLMSEDGIFGLFSTRPPQTNTARAQATDACLYMIDLDRTVTKRASCTLTPSGFTAQFSVANADRAQVFTLALAGLSARADSFVKSQAAAPAPQSLAGIGFRPELLLLSSIMLPAQPLVGADNRWGVSAISDSPLTERSAGVTDDADNTTESLSASWSRSNRGFVKINNFANNSTAEGNITAFTGDGFDLRWPVNDPDPTQITYLALATLPVPPDAGPVDAPPGVPVDSAPRVPVDAPPGVPVDAPAGVPVDGAAGLDGATTDRPPTSAPDARVGGPADAGPADARPTDGGPAGTGPDGSASTSDGPVTTDGGVPVVSLRPLDLRVGCACRAGGRAAGEPFVLAILMLAVPRLVFRSRLRRRERSGRTRR